MIVSASRRTDIPTYYSDWFFNRIKAGYAYVRNPMNFHQVSKISLEPDVVDGFVFWTKNPIPMLHRLDELGDYKYYFQFTVNSYGKDIESNIPSKNDVIIPAFKKLSDRIGPERVIWRYDPILLTERYSIEYHAKYFAEIAKRLAGYTHKCVISFVDFYKNTRANAKELGLLPLGQDEMVEMAKRLSEIADDNNFIMEACAEEMNLEQFGIARAHCIDCNLFESLLGCKLDVGKDKNQRKECGCAASVDIGMYNTCQNGCKYCYANYSANTVAKNTFAHNPDSPLLAGELLSDDVVKIREMKSCRQSQLNMFDE
ncbi:MAG: DUF1848 domain-containing protein [Clostridiales bacterium]|jgi:hypothetical protein|nr:DUF1848 domain-containing protein [Clostridiales bacterium]